jgi:hypothetical protein
VTNRDLAALLTKLLGLWLFLSFPLSLAQVVETWFWSDRTLSDGMSVTAMLAPLLTSVVYLGIGITLWVSGETVAALIFPQTRPLGSTTLTHEGLVAVGLGLTGVYLLALGIPGLVNACSLLALSYRTRPTVFGPEALSPDQRTVWFDAVAKANLAEVLTQVFLGMLLVLGPRRVKAAIVRARRESFGGSLEEDTHAEGSERHG